MHHRAGDTAERRHRVFCQRTGPLKPLGDFARQTGQINEESLTDTRLSEDTTAEFRQLSRSVNAMLDRLAQSFDTQRQFTGNAAHELRTPLALMQTRIELFAAEHPQMDAETARCCTLSRNSSSG